MPLPLHKIPFFAGKSEEALAKIQGEVVQYGENEPIFSEGDFADAFYIILDGEVKIFSHDIHGNSVILARLTKDHFFGERAFSEGETALRTASAIANKSTKLFKIPREQLVTHRDKELLQSLFKTYLQDKTVKTLSSDQVLEIKTLQEREILYHAGDKALGGGYVLLSGGIELRSFDENLRIASQVEVGLGTLFGDEKLTHSHTAIALVPSEVLVIAKDEEIPDQNDMKYQFTKFGKALQYKATFQGVPSFATMLFLKDGRKLLCHQVLNSQIVSIETLGVEADRVVLQENFERTRELLIRDKKMVGIKELGLWEDTDILLQAIVEQRILSDEEIETGKIKATAVDHDLVCTCMRISKKEISNAINQGCHTFGCIQSKTRACTVCGACRPTILEMLGQSAWILCKVTEETKHNASIRTFRFHPVEKISTAFTPGQHVIVRALIGNLEIRRSYTLTAPPKVPYFEVTIKKEEKGIFSPWIFEEAKKEILVGIAGPYGDFVLPDAYKEIICFAGGIGITPFVAFARAKGGGKLVIHYSARTRGDFAFKEELEKSGATLHFRITDEEGLLTKDEILKIVSSFEAPEVYICGPSGFENFIVDTLEERGFPSRSIHVEQFLQAGAPQDTPQMVTF